MTKKVEEVEKDEKVNQPEGAPVVQEAGVSASREVLSHQWQENSPALNTNQLAGYAIATEGNVMDTFDTPEKKKAREDAEKLKHDKCSHLTDEARFALDVSDVCYKNPSLGSK